MTAHRYCFLPLATLVSVLGWPVLSAAAQTSGGPKSASAPSESAGSGSVPGAPAPTPAPSALPPTANAAALPAPAKAPAAPANPGTPNPPSSAPADVNPSPSPAAAPSPIPAPASAPSAPTVAPTPSAVEPSPAPPPYPQVADGTAPPPAPESSTIHEPPLPEPYRSEQNTVPLPPPVPKHVAPRASLWAGVRPTVLMPLGSMWTDRDWDGAFCCTQNPRPFSEFASPGPGIGVDLGARFGRNYQAFAFGEYSFLGSGPLGNEFGGQESVRTSIFGAGVRFSTHPDSIGFLIEMSLGYRSFEAKWKDGTKLTANDDLFSTRLGVGGIWQINENMSVDVLILLGGGAFTDVQWTFPDGEDSSALSGNDDRGQYIPLGFQVGVHWDILRSKD